MSKFPVRNQPPPLPIRLKKDGTPDKRFRLYKKIQIETAMFNSIASIIPDRLRRHTVKEIIEDYDI